MYPSLKLVRKKIGLSLFLGFVTTIMAFIFLPFSGIDSLKEIALFGTISITVSYVLSWYYLQNILPPLKNKIYVREINVKLYDKKGFYIWLAILGLFLIFMPFLKFEDNLMNLDMKHPELNQRLSLIQKNFLSRRIIFFLHLKAEQGQCIDKKFKCTLYFKK